MTSRCHKLCLILLLASCSSASAQWSGFPLEGHTNKEWTIINETYHPIRQLYSGIVERCTIVGIATPTNVETWSVSAGYTNSIWTTNVITPGMTNTITHTNKILVSTNVVTTNVFGTYTYTYSDPSGTYVGTSQTFVTRQLVTNFDRYIGDLIPFFISTNPTPATNLNSYFTLMDPTQGYPSAFPKETKAGLFHRNSIGVATNITTNVWGFVNGGDAWFTREPLQAIDRPMAEAHFTGSWVFVDQGVLPLNHLPTNGPRPVITYRPFPSSNSVPGVTVTVGGAIIYPPLQTSVGASEVVVLTGTNTPLTNVWYDVSSITVSGTGVATGDVIIIRWTNALASFGDIPYALYARDLDERQQTINVLRWTDNAIRTMYTNYGSVNEVYSNGWSVGSAIALQNKVAATCDLEYAFSSAGESTPYFARYSLKRVYTDGGATWWYYGMLSVLSGTVLIDTNSTETSSLSPSYAHSADFYVKAGYESSDYVDVGTNTYDDGGQNFLTDKFALWQSVSETTGMVVSPLIFPITSPTWCGNIVTNPLYAPYMAIDNIRGARLEVGNVKPCVKWDGTSGIKYK